MSKIDIGIKIEEGLSSCDRVEVLKDVVKGIDALEKVKLIVTLDINDFITVPMASDYFGVQLGAMEKCIHDNREELERNELTKLGRVEFRNLINSLNIQEVNSEKSLNFRRLSQYVDVIDTPSGEQNITNKGILVMTKRTLLNIGMLLRDSEVAKELRRKMLDVLYDAEKNEGSIETIVEEIDEETKLSQELGMALVSGNMEEVIRINTMLFDLKNKRITKLEEDIKKITTTATTLEDSKEIVKKCIVAIGMKVYGKYGIGKTYNEFYSILNRKLNINIKNRTKSDKESWLDTLSFDEMKDAELIAKSWAVENDVDIKTKLTTIM